MNYGILCYGPNKSLFHILNSLRKKSASKYQNEVKSQQNREKIVFCRGYESLDEAV